MKTVQKFAMVAAGAVATMGMVASPASAASTATNVKTQTLTAYPNAGDATSCVSRTITLASGWYTWGLTISGSGTTVTRSIDLAAGSYGWADCLIPEDGSYTHNSVLSPSSGGSAELSSTVYVATTGVYTWGSYLDPSF